MRLHEKKVLSEPVFSGKIFDVTVDTAELEDGSLARRDIIHHPGGVCVVPVTEDGMIYLVRQFRYPFGEVTTEIPAGKLNYGEEHGECGRRELLEETGQICGEYIYLGEFYPTPAYNSEITHMYLARRLSDGEQCLDADEFLDVVKIPFTQAIEMVLRNEIKDGKTQAAILMAARYLGV